MRWVAWGCGIVLLAGGGRPASAVDGFSYHVVGVALPPKPEQADDPDLVDFYLDVGRTGGALPGSQFWVYRMASTGHGREVAIPVARLETLQVEDHVSIARIAALMVPADHALVEYRTVMIGDPVEPILGTGLPPLGERDLPTETIEIPSHLLPPLKGKDRARRTFSIPNVVLFDFDKSTLRAAGKKILDQIAAYVRETHARSVRVEGHTCSIGTRAYNQGLSRRRSAAAKRYLSEVLGIPGDRIVAVGYGETRPVASNATEAGRERNRRSEITVDGRKPARAVPDGLSVAPEAFVPETTHAGAPTAGEAPGAPPASAPLDLGPPLPELARPRS